MKKAAAFLLALCLAASSVAGPFGYYFAKAGGASAVPSLALDFTTAAADSRLTISGGTGGTRVDSTGTLVAASAPRFDYDPATLAARGLLIEEQRTNSLRNSTMAGASAGTPGTLPTNWSVFTSLTGLTSQVVGTGTENGVPYVDFRLSGAPSAAGAYFLQFETNTGVPAVNAQTWSASLFCRLAAGSLTGVSAARLAVDQRNGTGQSLGGSLSTLFTPTGAPLLTQRTPATFTNNNASTAFELEFIQLDLTGVAVDFTLRIGLPQLELGAFATSPILTSGTAVTRTADSVSMTGTNFSSWFNPGAGTFVVEGTWDGLGSAFPGLWAVNDGTTNNAVHVFANQSTNVKAEVWNGGVNQYTPVLTSPIVAGTIYKTALAYQPADFAATANGTAVVSTASGTVPPVDRLFIGQNRGNSALNGHVRRLRYFPSRLPNVQLQGLTQ